MREPDWATFGYTAHGYEGGCVFCDTTVELEFGDGEGGMLYSGADKDYDRDELFAYVYYWTLLKLERECDCEQ